MGETSYLVNPAKRQYIATHTLTYRKNWHIFEGALAPILSLLVHTPSPELPQHPLVAAWCGDALVVGGDGTAAASIFGSADPQAAPEDLMSFCDLHLDDISPQCVDLLCRMQPSYADNVANIPNPQPLFEKHHRSVLYDFQEMLLFGSALLLYHTPAIYHAMRARFGPGWINSYRQLYTLLARDRESDGVSTRNLVDPTPDARDAHNATMRAGIKPAPTSPFCTAPAMPSAPPPIVLAPRPPRHTAAL